MSVLSVILTRMTDDKNSPAATTRETTTIAGPTEVREGAQVIITTGVDPGSIPPPVTLDPPPADPPTTTNSGSGE
jgi:hypothetical protein